MAATMMRMRSVNVQVSPAWPQSVSHMLHAQPRQLVHSALPTGFTPSAVVLPSGFLPASAHSLLTTPLNLLHLQARASKKGTAKTVKVR
jgi:hypothetical protein